MSGPARWVDSWRRARPWLAATIVVVASVAVHAAVHAAGGSRTAWPHLFYLVIVAAAVRFGRLGGIVAGLLATVLCGPLMPLDVATGAAQPALNWLARGVFFTAVGGLAGTAIVGVDRAYRETLAEHLRSDLDLVRPVRATPSDEARLQVRSVLETGSFHLVFQPIYSLIDGALVAVEALSRFDVQPTRPPNEWFDLADAAGLGTELQLATLEATLEAARDLPAGVALAVNLSPAAVVDPRVLDVLEGRRRRRLTVEITEHAVVDDYTQLDLAITRLRASGATIAIDDAGAGFASLRHILRVAPEVIKLDITLTQNLRADPTRRALADCLIRFAHETGSQLVAEGIEDASDLHTWAVLGAHAAQGYHLGRPGPLPVPAVCETWRRSIDVRPLRAPVG